MNLEDLKRIAKHLQAQQLQQFQDQLGPLSQFVSIEVKDDTSKNDTTAALQQSIGLVHRSSQSWILQVANKLLRGSVFDGPVLPEVNDIPLPEDEEHDFHLGDWVKIKFSREVFKSVTKKVLGWNSRLNMVYGHVGVVTGVMSKYDNAVQLFFPEVFSECSLYAGVLQKVDRAKCEAFPSRWRVGEMVKAISEPELAMILQRGMGNIAKEFLGGKGRVTAITQRHVEVTFDEKQSCHVHPAALIPSVDVTPIERPIIEHARNFKVGEKAKMIKNVKALVENQKDKGGWKSDMIYLMGSDITIVNIQTDGTMNVQPNQKRAWRVNPDSVLKIDEPHPDFPNDLEFIPDDIVRFQTPNDLRLILNSANIPLSFLEYLCCPAKIAAVDDDLDIYLLFNAEQHIEAKTKAIRKATPAEVDNFKQVQNAVEKLKIDDVVHLDVGPPNYVRDVLSAAKADASIKMAMTNSAKLKGFTGPHDAVIEYSNGTRYKINKKYLTVPEKFYIAVSQEGINLKIVQHIKDIISNYVHEVHSKEEPINEDWKVEVLAMSSGAPPSVEIKVQSLIADPLKVYDWLCENSDWKMKLLCEGHMLVTGIAEYQGEVKVGIFFNDEELGIFLPEGGATSVFMSSIQESGHVDAAAGPIQQGEGRQQRVEDQTPEVEDVKEFKYIRFSNSSLTQDVYFPYVLHGPRRTQTQPDHETRQPQPKQVINNYNITNVDNINN